MGLAFGLLFVWTLASNTVETTPAPSRSASSAAPASKRTPAPKAKPAPKLEPAKPKKPTTQDVLEQVKLDFSWGKTGFGNIMEAEFTVHNRSGVDVKDLEIECHHFAPSGTKVDSNSRTIFEVVKAGQKRHFSKFNMGFVHSQATSSGCMIRNLAVLDSATG